MGYSRVIQSRVIYHANSVYLPVRSNRRIDIIYRYDKIGTHNSPQEADFVTSVSLINKNCIRASVLGAFFVCCESISLVIIEK